MAIRRRVTRFRPLVDELVTSGARLAGIALVAIGVSGLVAWGMGEVAGRGFVAGDPPGVTHTAARCADFLEYVPHATSCAQAATDHHFGEVVVDRVAAGILALLVLAAGAWRRRRRPRPHAAVLPDTLVPAVAAAVTGTVGLWLAGQGLDLVVLKTDGGGGDYLSAGIVALALACWFVRPVIAAIVERLPPAPAPDAET